MNTRSAFPFIAAMILGVISSGVALARSVTPPANHTGAPDHMSCLECHGGLPGDGDLTLEFAGGTLFYEPGGDYSLTVAITDPDKLRFGFSMVARDSDNLLVNVGTWSAGSSDTQVHDGNHIGHKDAPFAAGARTFTVNWQAPDAGVGDVKFYVAGNAANGNNNFNGDSIYLEELTISELLPQNQAPSFSLVATSFDVVSGISSAITGISLTDPDSGIGNLTVTASVGHGMLTIAESVLGGVDSGGIVGNGSANVTIEGTLAEITATFGDPNGIVYRSNSQYLGSDTIQLTVNDNGNTGAGGPQSGTENVTILVYPVPSLFGVVGLEDGSIEFTITGIPGRTYDVEHSEDLKDWVLLEEVTLLSNSTTITDLNNPTATQKFYRMGWSP
jgi:hypothetical protein